MKATKPALWALLSASFSLPLLAQTAMPRVDQRQLYQERRIEQGVQSGSLTNREAAVLERGQERVQRLEDRVEADGRVTDRERRRLDQAQDVESRRIYREKHDRQTDLDRDGQMDRHGNQGRRVGSWEPTGEGRHVGPREWEGKGGPGGRGGRGR